MVSAAAHGSVDDLNLGVTIKLYPSCCAGVEDRNPLISAIVCRVDWGSLHALHQLLAHPLFDYSLRLALYSGIALFSPLASYLSESLLFNQK